LERNERYLPELFGLREAFELAWTAGEAGEFLRLATALLFPSIRSRRDLDEGLLAALKGKSASRRREAFLQRNRRQNKGALLLDPQPLKEEPSIWYRTNYPRPWACAPVHAAYVDQFMKLAAAHKITVYWLLPPIARQAQLYCEQAGEDARYERFVRAALARHENLVAID